MISKEHILYRPYLHNQCVPAQSLAPASADPTLPCTLTYAASDHDASLSATHQSNMADINDYSVQICFLQNTTSWLMRAQVIERRNTFHVVTCFLTH